MTRLARWSLALTFILTLTATGYLAMQWQRSHVPAPAGFLAADKGYGVTIDLTQYDDAALINNLTSLRENNLRWLRQPINWTDVESAPGQFNWQPLDRVLAALARYPTLKLIVVLQTSPAWARPANTPPAAPPTELSDFGRFARVLAARYGGQIDYYQIWHEPNLSANWGNGYVDPAAYADLLREASLNIKATDPTAYILTAGLAPTLENGPLNLNDVTYLEQLYQAKADRWFDSVAGQLYGFDSEPAAPVRADALNFNRVELLRQVMLKYGDADTPLWATAFGWNALPADWVGQPAPWKSDTPAKQAERTAAALVHARRDWPWLGPALALRWDTTDLVAANDPARGFALVETPPVLQAIRATAANADTATPGNYPVTHPSGHYSPGWRFASDTADIPRDEPRTLTITFDGTRLDLAVTRGPYRGYLWVTIDGQPANALPQDDQGRSYVVLYDPLHVRDSVTLAQNLAPGPHQAIIKAEGGWQQWAISGWTVYQQNGAPPDWSLWALTGLLALLSGVGVIWQFLPVISRLWAWAARVPGWYAQLGERGHIVITFGLALTFYFGPNSLTLPCAALLALSILLRPDLGLMLTAFTLSFFQASRQLPFKAVGLVELPLVITAASFLIVNSPQGAFGSEWLIAHRGPLALNCKRLKFTIHYSLFTIHNLFDLAALALVALSLLSTLAAANFGVSMYEWRVLVLEGVIFYFLVRLGRDYGPGEKSNWRWTWRLVDAFVAGAVFHALLALYLYFFTSHSITAEGVRRAIGPVYGSPNNLSLFLDRVWPILLAVTLLPGQISLVKDLRRWLYGASLVIVSLTLYLTFSKGALLVGLPVSVVLMALVYARRSRYPRRLLAGVGGGLGLLALTLIPLSQTERFRATFDFTQGTSFFRLKLWQAALAMLRDHWPLGVGLDNFLYQYRTRYILPAAWQEANLSHPHNIILDFGTRLGLGGIILLLWLQAAFWRNAWRLYQRLPAPLVLGLMGSMAASLSHGLVDHAFFLVDLAFTFFLIAGIVQRLVETHDEVEKA